MITMKTVRFIELTEVEDGASPEPTILVNVDFVKAHCPVIRPGDDKGRELLSFCFPGGIETINVRETWPEIRDKIEEALRGQQDR